MAIQEVQQELQMFSYQALEKRWGISLYTIRRLVDKGELRAIGIAGRVLVPRDEVERAERFGVGVGRKRKAAAR
jgi:excisionase family DNA binding protein